MGDIPRFTTVKGSAVSKVLQEVKKATSYELAKMTGKTQGSIQETLKVLHRQSKVHIGDYKPNSRGKMSKVWFWGDGDDKLESSIRHKDVFVPRPDVAAAWMFNV